MLFLMSSAHSGDATSRVVYVAGSGSAPLDRHLTSLLQKQLGDDISLVALPNGQAAPSRNTPIISIGPSAFTRVRQANRSASILAMLVDRSFISAFAERAPGQITGVYYDVPLLRQALIGKVILPYATKIALLATSESAERYESLIDQLPRYNMSARIFLVNDINNLIPTLTRALGYGDFLLAAPDDDIYNPRTIKHILLTAYRRNKIIIGPSQAYVKAGSLASGYAPFSSMAEMAARFVNDYFDNGRFPGPAYPELYRAELNKQVARSLNIPLADKTEIYKAVQDLLNVYGEQGIE
jgi:ABC-type uncharacterized transport system substrate-binding protein